MNGLKSLIIFLLVILATSVNAQPPGTQARPFLSPRGHTDGGPNIITYVGGETTFTGIAIDPEGVERSSWDFNGDGIVDWESRSGGTVTWKYTKPGKYSAVFRAYDSTNTELPLSITKVVVRAGRGEAHYLPKQHMNRSTREAIETEKKQAREKFAVNADEEIFLELQPNASLAGGVVAPASSKPGDGSRKRYVLMINGGAEDRFWEDVTYAYDMFHTTFGIPDEDIFLLNYNGVSPSGTNPGNIIDYAATRQNLITATSILADTVDADDLLIVWVTDHGDGYTGPVQRASGEERYYGYLGGAVASVDPGDEQDYLEKDFKLRALYTGGQYGAHHGMDVWRVNYVYSNTKPRYYRNKFVSHFDNVFFEQQGVKSDNDIYLERFVDYLAGDTNRDGYIDLAAGEVIDFNGNGIPPYDPVTGAFDPGDWGEIDFYDDDVKKISSGVPYGFTYTYAIIDYGLDNHVDIDLNHDPANPKVNGTDIDNDGRFDGVDVNNNGTMTDWVSIDEVFSVYADRITDDELRSYLAPITAQTVIIMEPCMSGGFIEDLSGPNRIIMTATEEETVSFGNGFIRNVARAFTGINYPDSSGDPATADANHDGFVDFAEAFNFAAANDYGPHMEIPQYDDSGDGVSHPFPVPAEGDGSLGSSIIFGTTRRWFLTTTLTGSGSITASSPGYADLLCSGSSCSQVYESDALVTITAFPPIGYCPASLSGGCSGKGTCSAIMDAPRTVNISFVTPGVMVLATGSEFCSLSEAYGAVTDDSSLWAKTQDLYEDIIFDSPKAFSLQGGYATGYWYKTGKTYIHGSAVIAKGTVTMEDIVIMP